MKKLIFGYYEDFLKEDDTIFRAWKRRFKNTFPKAKLKTFELLEDMLGDISLDIVFVDYGGLWNRGVSELLGHYAREVINFIENNPNRLVVLRTDFTSKAFRDEAGEKFDNYPNLIIEEGIEEYWDKVIKWVKDAEATDD